MLSTEFGIVTEVKLEQSMKALFPILLTELPIFKDVKFLQPLNFIEHVVPDFTLMSSDDLVENILNHLCDEYGVKEMLLTYDVD